MALPFLSALDPKFANGRQRGTDYILHLSVTLSVQSMSVKGFFMGLSESHRKSSWRRSFDALRFLLGGNRKFNRMVRTTFQEKCCYKDKPRTNLSARLFQSFDFWFKYSQGFLPGTNPARQ